MSEKKKIQIPTIGSVLYEEDKDDFPNSYNHSYNKGEDKLIDYM